MTSATKYFILTKLDESIARQLGLELQKVSIWNRIMIQSGHYKGIKVGINSVYEKRQVGSIIAILIEKQKNLKCDTLANTVTV